MVDIQIEDYQAPEKAPHRYAGVVSQLVQAGPDKVASVHSPTEEEAKHFITDMQAAAREQNVSAVKRGLSRQEDGQWKASVAVRSKITRTRVKPEEVAPQPEEKKNGKRSENSGE